MLRKFSLKFICVALAATALIGAPAAKAETLTIGSSVQSLFSLPLYLAKAKGYFADEGLDINVVNFNGGATATPALLGGSIILQSAATENLLKVVHAGQPLKAVMVVQSTMNGGIIISKAAAAKVGHKLTIADVKGMRFGILARGGMADEVMRYVANDQKLDPDRDMTLIPMAQNTYGPAMKGGDLDGAQTVEPMQSLLVESTGQAVYMIDMLKGEGPALFQDMGWITLQGKTSWIEQNRETVRKIVRAMVKAQSFVADGNNLDEVVKLVAPVFPNIPTDLLKSSIGKQIHTYTPQITREIIAKNNELVVSTGQIPTPVAYEKAVDSSYADLWKEFKGK